MSPAEIWCRDILLLDSECIVVGLGEGDHITELIRQKRLSKIFVVDCRPELSKAFQKKFPELNSQIEVITLENDRDILSHPIMEKVLESNLSALAFSDCWPANND